MLFPGLILALGCILIGLFGAQCGGGDGSGARQRYRAFSGNRTHQSSRRDARAVPGCDDHRDAACAGGTGLAWMRSRMLSKREVLSGPTWDCGYAASSQRMQYTASSFAQPLTETFALLLRSNKLLVAPAGLFPLRRLWLRKPRIYSSNAYTGPGSPDFTRGLLSLRPFQQGRVQLYILYIALTLVVLLLWQLV